jgi:hypothetical protein
MPDSLILKVYNHNKKQFHSRLASLRIRGRELHHVFGRVGVRKACPILWVALSKVEHESPQVLKQWRESLREAEREIAKHYIRGEGCKRQKDVNGQLIHEECKECIMPIPEGI